MPAQEVNIGSLTLVDESGFNELDISISASGASDSDTTMLTGTMEVELNIDQASGTTDKMVINEAVINASDVDFRWASKNES